MINYNIFSYILQVFLQKEEEKLIKKYGDVTFLEIREELKKLGYPCKIAGEKNA